MAQLPAIGALLGVHFACGVKRPPNPVSTAAEAPTVDELLVEGGVLALRGHDSTEISIAFSRAGMNLEVRALGRRVASQARDTIDARGLYIHSSNAFWQDAPLKPGAQPLLVLRQGKSPGSPAVMLLNGRTGVLSQEIAPAENYPAGPISPHVGCYIVERGAWNNAEAATRLSDGPVPEGIRLHWQFKWHVGREHVLVATDGNGNVPGPSTNYYGWTSSPDFVTIIFGTGYTQARFRLQSEGPDLVGLVERYSHNARGAEAAAPVRLRRRRCEG